jgi:hypothetical protein
MITLNDDDSVSVKFYNQNPDGSYQPVYIRIDEKIPMSLKKEVYARSHDSDNNQRPEVWVPLVEKAFAQFAESYEGLSRSSGQGYQAIGEGGFINEALAIITGQQGHRAVVSRLSDEALLEIINNSQYVAAGSGAGNNTVPGGHAYSIQGVRHDGENLRIELRNPWGRMGGDTTYNNQGVFELSLKEFRTLFFGVYFVRGLALAM